MKGAQSAGDMAPVAPGISQYDPLGNIFFCSLMFAPITFLWQRGWQTFQTFDVFGKASVSIFTIYYIKICPNLFIWLQRSKHKIEITHPSHTEISLCKFESQFQCKMMTIEICNKNCNWKKFEQSPDVICISVIVQLICMLPRFLQY